MNKIVKGFTLAALAATLVISTAPAADAADAVEVRSGSVSTKKKGWRTLECNGPSNLEQWVCNYNWQVNKVWSGTRDFTFYFYCRGGKQATDFRPSIHNVKSNVNGWSQLGYRVGTGNSVETSVMISNGKFKNRTGSLTVACG